MAGRGEGDDIFAVIRGFFKLFVVAIYMDIKVIRWAWPAVSTRVWPFLQFTGLWAPLLIFLLNVVLAPLGVPGDIWGLPFLLSLLFMGGWTTRNWLARRTTTNEQGELLPPAPSAGAGEQERIGVPAHVSAQAAETRAGVFFGVRPPEVSGKGKPKGLPEPVTKPIQEDGHVLVIGGAGSGKSSCIAIPTLKKYWDGRFLAIDLKGELAEKSERPAHIFNPMREDTLGYDPFYLVRASKNPVPDIRAIALALAPLSPENRDPFWIQAAQNILTGHLLFGFKHGASFIETIDVLQSVAPRKLLETEIKDEQASRYLTSVVDLKPETLGSIMAQIGNQVSVFATDPDVQAALTKKDIVTPELLERGESIFLQLPEYKLDQWKQLLSLIVQQFLTHFERRAEGNQAPILFMLDEFARIGKIETILHGLATLRSKKITICILTQSLAQLDAIYGREQRQIIADNCSYKAILKATDAETQEYFSKLVGTEERVKITRSQADLTPLAMILSDHKQTPSISQTTEEKRIIKPEDFAYLQDIVVLTPEGVKRVQKVPYYTSQPPCPAPVALVSPQPLPVTSVHPATLSLTQTAQPPQPREEQQEAGRPESEAYRTYDLALEHACYPGVPGVPVHMQCVSFYSDLPPEERHAFVQYWQGQEREKSGDPHKRSVCQMIQSAAQSVERSQAVIRLLTFGYPSGARSAEDEERLFDLALEHACYPGIAGCPVSVQCASFYLTLPPEERPAFVQYWEKQEREKRSSEPQKVKVCQMIREACMSAEQSQKGKEYAAT
jgi:type IV secretion system protein VirD4